MTRTDGIRIRFGPDYNVAIDNIDFLLGSAGSTVAPVPIPAAIWLLGAAFTGLMGFRYKRARVG